MKWDRDNQSSDIEDRRGQGTTPPMMAGGGGNPLGLLLMFFMRFGWKGAVLAGLLILGSRFFMGGSTGGPSSSPQKAGHDESRAFVGSVLDDVQKTWQENLPRYQRAHVVLYSDATSTACGVGQSAVGPFYCPGDSKVYLDVSFFHELHTRFGAKGDFAQAYVIAHEVGHHVQHLLGTSEKVEHASKREQLGAEHLSVRLELQADCYAGVWAKSAEARGLLETGDIDEAMAAAASVGDDRLQKQASGTVQPEKWTHGSAAQRSRWFKRGYEVGKAQACDTFSGPL